ncbi:GNAT family N-acetyltransferase [Streptomyces sp. RFCAC02]|uniref:GNAT family N-acetyltransferase n=1 Tax=Streptomyces sp. RFCAC02 TaxID=2499143 RepID=UPI0019D245A1|nr:GNAT family N-acetyltransferase [Streptomyces sp. RFCAC02]
MLIRAARADEAGCLGELALRSKAHWGYDAAFMAACRDELTVTAEEIATTAVAERDGRVIGFSTFVGEPPDGRLRMMFVEPECIGQGVGRRLFEHTAVAAGRAGHTSLTFDADPHAVPFYRAMGASRIGVTPSGSIPGRMLPLMTLALADRRP